jgi:hypothetical protein
MTKKQFDIRLKQYDKLCKMRGRLLQKDSRLKFLQYNLREEIIKEQCKTDEYGIFIHQDNYEEMRAKLEAKAMNKELKQMGTL